MSLRQYASTRHAMARADTTGPPRLAFADSHHKACNAAKRSRSQRGCSLEGGLQTLLSSASKTDTVRGGRVQSGMHAMRRAIQSQTGAATGHVTNTRDNVCNPPVHRCYIIAAVDSLFKWVEAEPLHDKTAESTSQFMLRFLARHGCPQEVVTDNGTEFMGGFSRLLAANHVDLKHSSAYHPQANGLVERMNRTLTASLTKLTRERAEDWDICLPLTLWGYRTTRHASTLKTPFSLLYGREALLSVDLEQGPAYNPFVSEAEELADLTTGRVAALQTAHEEALEHIARAQERQAEGFRRKRQRSPATKAPPATLPFTPGMFVYVQTPGKGKKLMQGSPPLYRIVKLNPKLTTAELQDAKGVSFSAHVSRLSPFK